MIDRIELTSEETVCVFWGLHDAADRPDRLVRGPTDPLAILLAEGFTRAQIVEGAMGIEDGIEEGARYITPPLSDVQKSILRLCCENTTWIEQYRPAGLSEERRRAAHDTIRTLALKLNEIGIEVNFMPRLETG